MSVLPMDYNDSENFYTKGYDPMDDVQKFASPLIENIEKVIVGKRQAIEYILVALLCEGHVLLEDVPGSGKTMLTHGNCCKPWHPV